MLDKRRAKTWVKVVAWMLAISFALGMTILTALPGLGQYGSSSTGTSGTGGSQAERTLTPVSKEPANPADALVGQGDMAVKNDEIDQAVDLYQQAFELDKKNASIKEKLADAYFNQGQKAAPSDTAKAETAYTKYLEILPDGPHAEHVKAELGNLN